MHPTFVRLGVFSCFFEKEKGGKMHPNFALFGCLKKIWLKKNYFPTDRPKYSEIPLEGRQHNNFFFFGLIVNTTQVALFSWHILHLVITETKHHRDVWVQQGVFLSFFNQNLTPILSRMKLKMSREKSTSKQWLSFLTKFWSWDFKSTIVLLPFSETSAPSFTILEFICQNLTLPGDISWILYNYRLLFISIISPKNPS